MTQVLGISFDGIAAPVISLKPSDVANKDTVFGWGYGWYPDGHKAASVLKDATATDSQSINKLLSAWKRFHSTVFVCHIRGAAKNLTQQDTQPFHRSYAGREWIMLHNGDLRNYKQTLSLGDHAFFEPLGSTDSEHLFCWLMAQLYESGCRRLRDVDTQKLMTWLRKINELGTANIMLSDGVDLLVYQDHHLFNPLMWCRRHPPYKQEILESDTVKIDLSSSFDTSRTMIVFATQAMSDEDWVTMEPGQALLARRGWVQWDSALDENNVTKRVSPAIHTPRKKVDTKPALVTVYHETTYTYNKPVELSKHVFRLKPLHDEKQEIQSFDLNITPAGEQIDFTDVFGNSSSFLKISQPYTTLSVVAKSKMVVYPRDLKKEPLATEHQRLPLVWMPWQRQILSPYLLPPELPAPNLEELSEYAMSFVQRNDGHLLEVLDDINNVIYTDYTYRSKSTTLATTPYNVYVKRRGVCQDFANLFICLARLLNIPARYRTGYIYTGQSVENQAQSDASHAWVEVYIPLVGWRGYDPTNGVLANTDHVKIACGRNYRDATPTAGTIYEGGSSREKMTVNVQVTKEEI